jgi:hypothetical protein
MDVMCLAQRSLNAIHDARGAARSIGQHNRSVSLNFTMALQVLP